MKFPKSAIDLLSSGVVVHMATVDDDGKPHVTCAWADVDSDELRIATMFDQRKLRNLRRDPRVTISATSNVTNDFGLREYIVVYGTAEITEGGAAELLQQARLHLHQSRCRVPRHAGPAPWIHHPRPARSSGRRRPLDEELGGLRRDDVQKDRHFRPSSGVWQTLQEGRTGLYFPQLLHDEPCSLETIEVSLERAMVLIERH